MFNNISYVTHNQPKNLDFLHFEIGVLITATVETYRLFVRTITKKNKIFQKMRMF